MHGGDDAGDRRQRTDRRAQGGEEAGEGRRGGTHAGGNSPLTRIVRAIGAVVALVIVIVATLRMMHPVYATRGTLGDELRKRAPGAAAAIGAFDSTNVDKLMATPTFQEEKRNFYEDVMRLKQVDSARADSIAQFAVREAYIRGISPAIIFGVMLTENSRFISKAQSNVGAVGLMQVYPKVWLTKEMTALFGKDLATDSTNVKYGVFILSHYFNPKVKGGGTKERDWATALLRYNGCVRGTNTPRCHTYPSKVQGFVEKQATSICNGRGFYDCIAKPFIEGLFTGGRLTPDPKKDSSTAATTTQAGEVAGAAPAAVAATPAPTPPATPALPVATPAPAPASRPASSTKSPSTSSAARSRGSKGAKASKSRTAKAAPKKPVKKASAKRSSPKADASLKAPKPIKLTIP
jgi:hypothetical protein